MHVNIHTHFHHLHINRHGSPNGNSYTKSDGGQSNATVQLSALH